MTDAVPPSRGMARLRIACAVVVAVSLTTSRFGMQLGAIYGILFLLASRLFDGPLPSSPLDRPGLALLGAAWLSLAFAPGGFESAKTAGSWWVWLTGWVAFHGLRGESAARRTVQALLWCAASAAVLGLVQAGLGVFPAGAWLHPQAGPLPPPAPGAPGHFAATGWFDSRVTFGLVMMFPFCWQMAIGWEARRPLLRWALWAGAALAWLAMLASYTRAAPAAAAGAGFVLAARSGGRLGWRRAVYWLPPLLAGALLILAVPGLWDRARQSFERNRDWGRLALWHTALDLAARRPLLGVGYGNFKREALPLIEERVARMGERRFGGVVAWAHNDLLTMLAECGLAGAFALCWLLVVFFRESGRNYARLKPDDVWRRGFVRGSRYAVAALILTSMFHDNFYHGEISFTLWFAMGAALAMGRRPEETP